MTVEDYINALPFDKVVKGKIKKHFIEGNSTSKLEDSIELWYDESLISFLQGAFIYANTPEGDDYWNKKRLEEELWIQCGNSPR